MTLWQSIRSTKVTSRAKVQQRDTYPEPTLLRLIGYLTDSTWTQKIRIKYFDTKNQLADMLTKGNFTRDEWNNLHHLFNISIFSSASCPETMSKRMQQRTGEEIIVAKSKPTMNLVSRSAASSPTAPSSSASSRPGTLRAPSQQGWNLIAQCAGKPAAGGSNQNDAASSSQVWLTDAKMSERARKLAAVDTNQDQSCPERARKLAAENFDINDEDDSEWPHNLRISRANAPHLEKVYSNLRQQLKRKPEDNMEVLDVKYLNMENVCDCDPTSKPQFTLVINDYVYDFPPPKICHREQ